MKLDYTIKNIIIEIKNELKEEEDIDISEQEIFNICNSQFIGGVLAKIKKISFSLSHIGHFLYKDLNYYFKNIKETDKIVKEMDDEERKKFLNNKKTFHKKEFRASNMKVIRNLEDLPDDIVKTNTYVHYTNVLKQIKYNESNE